MAVKMTLKARSAASKLAVAYANYRIAIDVEKHTALTDNHAIVWGGMLLDAQVETGIELARPAHLRDLIDRAREREATRKQNAAA